MGQFYRGAEATFLDDAMFKLPYELMGKIIEKKDKEVNDSIDTLTAYQDKLKADVLEEDSPATRAKIQEYQQRIDSTISNIQSDPMNYNTQLGNIKAISRDITRDWSSTGEIGSREANKKLFLAEKERIADLVKAGKLDPTIATMEEAKIREKYKAEGGLKWNKESQKAENALDIQNQYYKVDFDEKFLTHMKPEEWSEEYDKSRGMYIYTNKYSGKQLTREDIIDTYLTQLGSDTPTLYAANRYGQLGGDQDLPGYEGVNRMNEATYYETVKGKDGKDQKVLRTNPNNYWGRKAEAAAKVFEQRERSTSQTMKNDSFAQSQWEREQDKPEEIIIDTDTEIGMKNASTASSITTYAVNNASLTNVKSELSNLAKANGIKEGTAAYNAVISGNPAAIKAMFTDPKTADKYIKKYNDINMEVNMQKAAIEQFNITYSKELGGVKLDSNPRNWTKSQQELYDQKITAKPIQQVSGKATYNGLGMNAATQKEHQTAVEQGIVNGVGTFNTTEGIPSMKYNGAKVRYLDKNNNMYTSALDPGKKVAITVNGKVYYSKNVNKDNKYIIDGKVVKVDARNILVTEPSNGPVNLPYYAQQGHLQSGEVFVEEEGPKGEKVQVKTMGFRTMEGNKMVDIVVDKANTAPSWVLDNKKENYTRSSLKIGSQAVEIEVKGITTPKLQAAWDNTYEMRNLETTKVKYGNNFKATTPGPNGSTYRVEDGKYYKDTPTRKGDPITDANTIYQIDQAVFYKRN
jgi:hypothetical protein